MPTPTTLEEALAEIAAGAQRELDLATQLRISDDATDEAHAELAAAQAHIAQLQASAQPDIVLSAHAVGLIAAEHMSGTAGTGAQMGEEVANAYTAARKGVIEGLAPVKTDEVPNADVL